MNADPTRDSHALASLYILEAKQSAFPSLLPLESKSWTVTAQDLPVAKSYESHTREEQAIYCYANPHFLLESSLSFLQRNFFATVDWNDKRYFFLIFSTSSQTKWRNCDAV